MTRVEQSAEMVADHAIELGASKHNRPFLVDYAKAHLQAHDDYTVTWRGLLAGAVITAFFYSVVICGVLLVRAA